MGPFHFHELSLSLSLNVFPFMRVRRYLVVVFLFSSSSSVVRHYGVMYVYHAYLVLYICVLYRTIDVLDEVDRST